MRMHEILGATPIMLTNEETEFVNRYGNRVLVASLYERDSIVGRNLVRKGVYDINGKYLVHKNEK